jgi:hypothetical protein
MKINYKILLVLLLTAATIVFVSFKKLAPNKKTPIKTMGIFEPVAVVELFTSQGCSSCPPADKLLEQTIKNTGDKKIFALSFHVDYWNRLGWADPFSNAAFSKRQNDYVNALNTNGAYTPQIIVNGSREFVGSDKTSLNKALNEELNNKSLVDFSTISATVLADKRIKVSYTLQGKFADCKINAALISKTETTVIKRGENGGTILTNENVVREFVTQKAKISEEITFANPYGNAKESLAVIVYIQQQKDYKITGAAMAGIE